MNLPIVNQRVSIVQKAERDFSIGVSSTYKDSTLKYTDCINIYSQCIINASQNFEKLFLSEEHKKIEELLENISNQYDLTYGEKIKILSSMLCHDVKYVIRWERHKDLNKEGDLE